MNNYGMEQALQHVCRYSLLKMAYNSCKFT